MEDPKKYLEQIMERGIEFYDYHKGGDWQSYFSDAQFIAKNEVFNNELTHYMADLVKFCALEAKDFDQVLHTRTGIIVLETLRQRLESIEDPHKQETNDEPFSEI